MPYCSIGPSCSLRMSCRKLNHVVRCDAKEIAVQGGVVDLAQCKTVAHYRLAVRMSVREYVRGVEQPRVSQSAADTATPNPAARRAPS